MKYHQESNNQEKKFVLYGTLFSTYFLLKPFYFFQSGIPQISDIILVVLLLIILITEGITIDRPYKAFLTWNGLWVFYILIVNGLWGIFLGGELELIKFSLYYLFNFLIILLYLHLYSRWGRRLLKTIYNALALTTLVQIGILLVRGFDSSRETLFFNNPNQLGYFGILTTALIIIIYYQIKPNLVITAITLLGALLLTLTSLSKAAIVSGVLMLTLFILKAINRKSFLKTVALYLLTLMIAGGILYTFGGEINERYVLLQSVQTRIASIGHSNDDSLGGRGYDRIRNHPQYLIFGGGEGSFRRFESKISGEIHSTLGNVLFSYGGIGFILLMGIFYQCIRGKRWYQIYPLVCILLYGLTHNGIRQSLFWIILCLMETEEI